MHSLFAMGGKVTGVAETRLKLRKKLVNHVADQFENSGIRYTCAAVVMDYAAPVLSKMLFCDEYKEHQTHSVFKLNKLKRHVADEIHRRKYGTNVA